LTLPPKKKKSSKWKLPPNVPIFGIFPKTAAQFSEELAQLKQNISDIENLQLEVALLAESPDEVALTNLSQKIAQKEIFIFLSQKYDSENAILTIYFWRRRPRCPRLGSNAFTNVSALLFVYEF